MAIISEEDIKGFEFGGELVCAHCVTETESDNRTEDEILTQLDDDKRYFCDRCHKELE